MKIRLDRVVDEPFDWQETLDVDASDLDLSELLKLEEVRGRGRIHPTYPGHLLEASLSYRQTLRCMRCLERFVMPATSEMSLLIQIQNQETTEEEVELTEKDLGTLTLREPELDTRTIVLEQLHLGVPMKPLCREDCSGLCTSCGQNLNNGPCDCRATTDPRWGALAGLKLDRDNGTSA